MWFGLFGVLLCGLLRHSVYLQFLLGFQTIQFQLPFKMSHNLFICAILQMRLFDWFLQVGRHFGIYEVFDDHLSSNSECMFHYIWSSSRKSINFWFAALKTSRWNFVFCCSHWLGFHVLPTEHSQSFSQTLSVGIRDVFEGLYCITTHERVEIVDFVFFCQLVVNFQTFLEQIFKQLEFLWFSFKGGHCRSKGFRQFRDSVDVVVVIGWNTVRRQLLKGQQNPVCFNCRRGVLTAKLWLTCGARFLRKSQVSCMESLPEILSLCEGDWEFHLDLLLSPCEDTLPPLSYIYYQSDEERISLRDRDRLGNDPHWAPSFLGCCSGMFPERLRNRSELVVSEEIRRVLTKHAIYETLSDWHLLRVS